MRFSRFAALCFTLCVLSSILTFCIANAFLVGKPSEPANKKTKAEDLYSSSLILDRVYQKCGHTATVSESGTITFSSTEELTKRFPGYEVTSGDREKIVMTAKINNFCPNHFKATLSGSKIVITRLWDNAEITTFSANPQSFSPKEKSLLEEGITLDSQKALSSFIEDFTS